MPSVNEWTIIQGGMGVAVSDWRLARAVSSVGQLGVVSGTALEVVCARRLQQGDPGGHVRRALAHFPDPAIADWIVQAYFVEGGLGPTAAFAAVPRWTLAPAARLQELTVASSFVEVYLAKEGHDGAVGINFLRKIELPLPFALYGAMLAGVDYVLVGAGNPSDVPGLVRRLADRADLAWPVRVQGATSADGDRAVVISPRALAPDVEDPLVAPRVLAIVASVDLAAALAADPGTRPDGFVVEGSSAGGHNAPPRGPRRLDALGQPAYDERDVVDVPAIVSLGLPVWLAGSYGSPERLGEARAQGAAGVQLGTAFALCQESGLDAALKTRVLDRVAAEEVSVRADWRVSPTGFPFRVLELAETLSDPDVVAGRRRVCDLGALRSPYRTDDGGVAYRCPAEPTDVYVRRKGGREANTEGRTCLCNALLASAGLAQKRPHGYVEPALVTAGSDFSLVGRLMAQAPDGRTYAARDVVRLMMDDAV
ncbi:MAG TPA: nitronate monooxygenase [Nocardioides sp.]|uniref:nitronate monooxygenase n=1 Tax=Nocardioides sp. TaxID=35761 RepID=UPI002BE9D2FB|nr:nitronate monooxygenase [Nocardioides sp.]HQR27293.1 nitronate monooxygenase [Nocardioides sp.]